MTIEYIQLVIKLVININHINSHRPQGLVQLVDYDGNIGLVTFVSPDVVKCLKLHIYPVSQKTLFVVIQVLVSILPFSRFIQCHSFRCNHACND